jgi:PAS domain S-box-containing protein
MAKTHTPQDHEDDGMKDPVRGKLEKMFSEQEVPTYVSQHEVESMKDRIQELEADLKQYKQTELPTRKEEPRNEVSSSQTKGAARFWAWFTEAHPGITETRERNSARLAASFLFIIMLLEIVGAFARVPRLGLAGAFSGSNLLALIPTVLAYALSRTKWYRGAIFIFSLFFGSLAYVTMVREGSGADISTLILVYVPLSLIVASTFLSSWAVLLMVGLNLGAFFLTTRFGIEYTSENFGAQSGIIITMGMVLIALASFRKRSEEQTLQEIKTVNEELQVVNTELTENREKLEQRVADRTRDLKLASEVGNAISQKVDDLQGLLLQATELIRDRFDLYYTQIYLVDAGGRTLTLRAGTGTAGAELIQHGHRLLIGPGSLNGQAAFDKKAVVVADTTHSKDFLPNRLLPNTRSEMVMPLVVGDKVLGALDMQSERPGAFSDTNLSAFEALAGQLSIAIQNASLFAEAEAARAEVEARARHQTQAGWQELLNAIEREEILGYAFNQNGVYSVSPDSLLQEEPSLSVPISVTGAEVGTIQFLDESDRLWSANETEIARMAADVLGHHIDNLRLLAQAEDYRSKAEQAARRLTREGWESFLKTRKQLERGYVYDLNQVQFMTEKKNGSHSAIAQPIVVQTESMGELAVASEAETSQEAREIVAAVAAQLSNHIENLRLLEQTQERSLELEETETFLNSVIESMPNMLFVKDAEELRFVRWNKAAEEIAGFSQEQMLGKNDYDFFPKEEADFFTSKDRQVLTEGNPIDIAEETLVTPHRGARLMHTRKAPVYGLDGKPKYLLGVAEDITEQKKAEEALARRATELATVAQVNTTASTVLDPDKLLQAVVDLTKERFGLYHAHIYLTNESWNTLLLAAGAGEIGRQMVSDGWNIPIDHEQSIVARAARSKQSVIANDLVRDTNSTFLSHQLLPDTRSEMAVPMIIGDQVLGVFDVQSDTVNYFSAEDAHIFTTLATQTAIALQNARLYAEQAATLTQLRELDKLKSSFLANMSHELRTPLNSILGFTDVMLEGLDGPLTDYMENDLRLVQKNGQHLLHLINDVLDMAKIEAGKMNLHPEIFKVHELLHEVTGITSTLASDKNLSLFIEEVSDQDVEIYADHTRLRQVMINLVNNAIKFTEKGEVCLSTKAIEGGRVLVSVKDTGIGIPPEKLDSIFQEFTQVDTSTTRKAGGTGLGLPISRRLVEMHGGRLWAESTGVEGEGASFYVELPVEARITEVIEKQEK